MDAIWIKERCATCESARRVHGNPDKSHVRAYSSAVQHKAAKRQRNTGDNDRARERKKVHTPQ